MEHWYTLRSAAKVMYTLTFMLLYAAQSKRANKLNLF